MKQDFYKLLDGLVAQTDKLQHISTANAQAIAHNDSKLARKLASEYQTQQHLVRNKSLLIVNAWKKYRHELM